MMIMGIFKKATPLERTLEDERARLANLKTQLDKANAAEERAAELRRAHYRTGDIADEAARKHADDTLVSAQRSVEGLKDAIAEIEPKIAATEERIALQKAQAQAESAAGDFEGAILMLGNAISAEAALAVR
jgi:hypothetical protein